MPGHARAHAPIVPRSCERANVQTGLQVVYMMTNTARLQSNDAGTPGSLTRHHGARARGPQGATSARMACGPISPSGSTQRPGERHPTGSPDSGGGRAGTWKDFHRPSSEVERGGSRGGLAGFFEGDPAFDRAAVSA